jgi:hypothetical protein
MLIVLFLNGGPGRRVHVHAEEELNPGKFLALKIQSYKIFVHHFLQPLKVPEIGTSHKSLNKECLKLSIN